jgi:putative flippase GtrA
MEIKALAAEILSRRTGPFWQFVKYGVIGVASTAVQMAVFYVLAATVLSCLTADDWAVRLFGLPWVDIPKDSRAVNFAVATAVGFAVANVFCWLMNRTFVFTPGRYGKLLEFIMFFSAAASAALIAIAFSALLIRLFSMMTSLAAVIEVLVSFAINFAVRKFVIFKG